MNWFWSLLIYFVGLLIGIAISNRRSYRRGLRDGTVTAMLNEVMKENNSDRTACNSRVE